MVQQLQKLQPKHRRMMIALEIEGKTPNEVCAEYNITRAGLWQIRKSHVWKQEEDVMKKELRSAFLSKMRNLVPRAIQALEETVGEENIPRDRIHASKEILDRSGIIKPSQTEPEEEWFPVDMICSGSSGVKTIYLPRPKK
tara:strand:- start:2976 stop:3398 length:423 start_codon:yes stop_codon:yes gene_type:complete